MFQKSLDSKHQQQRHEEREDPQRFRERDTDEQRCGLAGGGAQIKGLAERLEDIVKMRVWVAEDSMTCVARGAGRVLENLDLWDRALVGLHRGSTH